MVEEYTIDGYLGSGYQLKVMWQLLTESEFANKVFPFLKTEYFDDPNHRRFFTVLREYYDEFGKVPNLQNTSIELAITRFKQATNPVDEEILRGIVENIKNWNARVINKNLDYDGDIVQKAVFNFIKQGEYCDLADFIMSNVKKGFDDQINQNINERTKKISEIGVEEDNGTDVFDDIETVLQKDYREPIPTGIKAIDKAMGGGLGKGEIGIILAGTGVGKSTALTKIANEAHSVGKNVLHITFEDNTRDIKRKHYAIWSGVKLSEMDDPIKNGIVAEKVKKYQENSYIGTLTIKKFSQDGITIPIIRQYIDRYKKQWGIKFDIIVLDYIDCVESHVKGVDENKRQEATIKAFEAMASDYNIPCWTAIQANRTGLGDSSEFIGTHQMGGSIKRAQKTHFLMSVAKTAEQKEAGLANIAILKSRFGADGQKYEDAIFSNDEVRIVVRDADETYPSKVSSSESKETEDVDFEKKLAAFNRNSALQAEGKELEKLDNNDVLKQVQIGEDFKMSESSPPVEPVETTQMSEIVNAESSPPVVTTHKSEIVNSESSPPVEPVETTQTSEINYNEVLQYIDSLDINDMSKIGKRKEIIIDVDRIGRKYAEIDSG